MGSHLCQMLCMGLPGTRHQLLALRELMGTAGIFLSAGKRLSPLVQPLGKPPQAADQKHNGDQCNQYAGRDSAEESQEHVPHEHLLLVLLVWDNHSG